MIAAAKESLRNNHCFGRRTTPSPVPIRRGHPLSPRRPRVAEMEPTLPSPPWGRGAGGEGVCIREWNGYYVTMPKWWKKTSDSLA